MSRDAIYTHTFKGANGVRYQLQFIPGNNTALSSPDYVELPVNCILTDITTSNSFENNIPLGIAGGGELKINVVIDNLKGTKVVDGTTYDFADVRKYMVQNFAQNVDGTFITKTHNDGSVSYGSPPELIYIGKTVKLPNQWKLFQEGSMGNFTIIKFHGLQEYRKGLEGEFQDRRFIQEITAVSIVKKILENIEIEDLNKKLSTGVYPGISYTVPSGNANRTVDVQIVSNLPWNHGDTNKTTYITLTTLFDRMEEVIKEFYLYYSRSSDAAIQIPSMPFSHIQCYKQDTDIKLTKGAAIASSWDLLILPYIYDNDLNFIGGGLLSDNSENSFNNIYKNLWDLFKFWSEGNICKAYYLLDETGASPALQINFTTINNEIDITPTITRFRGNTIKPNGSEVKNKSESHLKGMSSPDPNEFEAKQADAIYNDSGQSLQVLLHGNLMVGKLEAVYTGFVVNSLYYINPDTPYTNSLKRVSDYMTIDLGGSVVISPESTYNDNDFPTTNTSDKNWKELYYEPYITDRTSKCGLPYVANKALLYMFGNSDQVIWEGDLDVSQADPTQLGYKYTLSKADLFESTTELPPKMSETSFLVKAETNWNKSITNCTFFSRGY